MVVVEQQMKFVIDQLKVRRRRKKNQLFFIYFIIIFNLFLVITFIDLAGHTKYIKTTLFGLAAHAADFAMLCIDAPSSVVDTTREHFSYARTLDVPVFIVINKIDLCSKTSIQQTITCLTYLLKHGNSLNQLQPYVVKKEEDLVKAADMFIEKSICPIFAVSCVTGENIDLLKKFLNILPPRLSIKDQERLSLLPVEYRVSFISFFFSIYSKIILLD
jgi:GTPase